MYPNRHGGNTKARKTSRCVVSCVSVCMSKMQCPQSLHFSPSVSSLFCVCYFCPVCNYHLGFHPGSGLPGTDHWPFSSLAYLRTTFPSVPCSWAESQDWFLSSWSPVVTYVPSPLGQIHEAYSHTLHLVLLMTSRITLEAVGGATTPWSERVSLVNKPDTPANWVLYTGHRGSGQVIRSRELCTVLPLLIAGSNVSCSRSASLCLHSRVMTSKYLPSIHRTARGPLCTDDAHLAKAWHTRDTLETEADGCWLSGCLCVHMWLLKPFPRTSLLMASIFTHKVMISFILDWGSLASMNGRHQTILVSWICSVCSTDWL